MSPSSLSRMRTDTDTQMDLHPGFELDPELEPNYEGE
jgi:hypothetical protein